VVRAILLVAAVGLIGVLLYRQISRLAGDRVSVWVSATELRVGQPVTAGVLRQVQLPRPKGAIADRASILGRVLTVAKGPDQPFYPADLAPLAVPAALATTIPPGRLLATVKLSALDLPSQELRNADRLDIIQAGSGGVSMIAHDVYMMGHLSSAAGASKKNSLLGIDLTPPDLDAQPTGAEALVLALLPKDVFPLAAAEASGQRLKIVLHSDADVKAGRLLNAAPAVRSGASLPAIEIISGTKRQRVYAADAARTLVVAPPQSPAPTPRAVASR